MFLKQMNLRYIQQTLLDSSLLFQFAITAQLQCSLKTIIFAQNIEKYVWKEIHLRGTRNNCFQVTYCVPFSKCIIYMHFTNDHGCNPNKVTSTYLSKFINFWFTLMRGMCLNEFRIFGFTNFVKPYFCMLTTKAVRWSKLIEVAQQRFKPVLERVITDTFIR